MTRQTIDCCTDWFRSLKRKNKIILTEYKNGVAQNPKHVED